MLPNKEKGFASVYIFSVIFLTILIVGIRFVALYRQQTRFTSLPSLYAKEDNQNTYQNSKLAFQLIYAKDFNVKEDAEEEFNKRGNGDFRKNFKGYVQYDPGKFLGAVVVLDKTKSYDTNPFTVWVFDNPTDLTIDGWYKLYWYYPFVWGDFTYTGKFELAPKDEATVSGQLGKSGIIDYQPGKPRFVYVAKDKKMYLFRIISEAGSQILLSFKFH